MHLTFKTTIPLCLFTLFFIAVHSQTGSYNQKLLQEDFNQFREILENEHCCLYEYTPKSELDSMFAAHYRLIDHDMKQNDFFMLLAPITSRIGCMHTATWMPGGFFITKPKMMFPLTLRMIDDKIIVSGNYNTDEEVPRGSILLEINKKPIKDILEQLRSISSADALNPYFIDAQIMQRFSMFYASIYGLPDQYEIKYLAPGLLTPEIRIISPADHESVRKVVFSHFNSPPLGFEILKEKNTAIMTVNTFIYYDRVDYFRNFMDSCFHLIKRTGIDNLILDIRGNTGGDPFCSSILLSYLQKSPVPYFAEEYGRYSSLANPLPIQEDQFSGRLYILIDGSCGSTNGHFSALLKYHKMGKFIGTPSGSTYKCNAGRNTEFRLSNTQMIITIGRSTYAAAVKDMVKTAIMPDIYVKETHNDFLENRDPFMEAAIEQINTYNQSFEFKPYPQLYEAMPEIASPCIFQDTMEIIVVETKNNRYGIVPVTQENGNPLLYSYKVGTMMGKDQQLHIDSGDFPNLAKTGLHSDVELDKKVMITGIPIDVINCTGRPNAYSISGFFAADENIISVLKGDNHHVKSMNLTHPRLAKPLFHIWNLILKEIEVGNWEGRFYENIKHIYYNGNQLNFEVGGSKGWQISIFFDEIQGRHDIHINRDLTPQEDKYLKMKYSHLNEKEMATLIHKLTNLVFSEMNPFYIMRYGFYEGHTEDYRCDPIAIALIFGLRSIEEIDDAFNGDLLNILLKHYNSETD